MKLQSIHKPIALAFVCGALASLAACSSPISTYQTDANGFDTKNFYYDSGKEVVVFDTQFTPGYAEEAIAQIQSETDSPIRYVVITHPNPDKFNAMESYRKAGAKIIASEATARALPGVHAYKQYYFVNIAGLFTKENYPQPGKPDVVFNKEHTIELDDGKRVELRELGSKGVSSNQTVAWIPEEQALFVGDLIHHEAHAWLEGPVASGKPQPDLDAWIATLRKLESLYPADATVYAGRGETVSLGTAVAEQIEYLNAADRIVSEYIREKNLQASDLQGDGAQAHYAAIQKRLEERFPDYRYGYMVGYSVYGLLQSRL